MKTYRKICINCPAGCHLEISVNDDGAIDVRGNRCPRGQKYAETEIADPRRTVTAVVRSEGPEPVCVPVKTSAPLPRRLIPELLEALAATRAPLPIGVGDAVLKNFRESGIDVVATRAFPASR